MPLADFATWAVSVNLELPPELAAMAQKAGKATAPDQAPESAAPNERVSPKLILPDKSDIWAEAIAATYETMVLETGGTPSASEVWLRMNHKPPATYPIKETKEHGLAAIGLPGEKLLTRDAFTKRWKRYTAAK